MTVNYEQYELRPTSWALTGKEGGAEGMKYPCCTHKTRDKDAVRGTAGRAAACMGSKDTEQRDNHTGRLLRMVKVGIDTAFDVQ